MPKSHNKKFASATDNTARKEIELISLEGKQWARYAFPVRERVPTDFIWQRSPFQLEAAAIRRSNIPESIFCSRIGWGDNAE